MANSNLIPTPITDKNGKVTTVHRRPDIPQDHRAHSFGPPVVTSAYIPPKEAKSVDAISYSERLEAITEANERWVSGDKPSVTEMAPLAAEALNVVGNLMLSAVDCQDKSEGQDLGIRISELGQSKDYAAIILADRFAAVHYTLRVMNDPDVEWMDDEDDAEESIFGGQDTSDWDSEYAGASDNVQIIDMVMTLREMNLMSYVDAPEHGDKKFFAHLYMNATEKINYRHDDEKTLELIRLVDEFPEHGEAISEGINKGLHAEGIKALIDGELHTGLVSGAL